MLEKFTPALMFNLNNGSSMVELVQASLVNGAAINGTITGQSGTSRDSEHVAGETSLAVCLTVANLYLIE